jgi:hypothetical protein
MTNPIDIRLSVAVAFSGERNPFTVWGPLGMIVEGCISVTQQLALSRTVGIGYIFQGSLLVLF